MFTDCLEVEENLKMSNNLSDQDSGGEVKYTFKLVGPYKQNGKVPGPLKLSPGIHKDDRPSAKTCGPVGLFSEDGNLHRIGSVKDDCKKEFCAPVYDEYEDEYLQNMPDEPTVEGNPTDERYQDAM